MKFIKLSFSYLKKNFLYLLAFAVVPTVFIGILLKPFSLFHFVNIYPTLQITGFGSIFNALFQFSFVNILLTLLGLIILSVFVSIGIGNIENHMRSGKLNLKSTLKFINNNFLVVFVNILIIFASWFVLMFVYSGVLCLTHIIFSGINSFPSIFLIVFAIILASAVFVLFIEIIALFALNIPNMLINGYPAKQAFSNSIKLLNRKNFEFLFAMLVPFVVIIPLASIFASNLIIIPNIVGLLLILTYYPSLIMTGYFELSNTPRYDNRSYYNYNV